MSFSNLPASKARLILTVATTAALPTGVPKGSIRFVIADNKTYTFNGSTWDALT